MSHRALRFFVFAAFVYWTTGLGQYFHEKYEHWHPDDADVKPAKNGSKPLQEADDHDDCNICQTIKAMKAHAPDAPKAPEPSLPSVDSTPTFEHVAPAIVFVVFIPARAPPAISASV